jgi:hypothetical protein
VDPVFYRKHHDSSYLPAVRELLYALIFSLVLSSLAPAGTLNIPEDKPAISVDIPDSWKPETTDKGIACESPDKVATIFFEVTSAKGLEALIDENVDWLTKDQGVQLDKASEQTGDSSDGIRSLGKYFGMVPF